MYKGLEIFDMSSSVKSHFMLIFKSIMTKLDKLERPFWEYPPQ